MLISDNEYGAPWNDQFYWVTVEDEEETRWDEMLVLSGPRNYDDYDLLEAAQCAFPQYNIIEVRPYEIFG